MTLPLFPLQSVFFPGERIPLHIFEDRYKVLIADCREKALTFGIPVYINSELRFGIEAQLMEIVHTYEGGAMDVLCVGRQVFRVLDFNDKMSDKPYPGGEVRFLETVNDGSEEAKDELLTKIKVLYELMEVSYTPVVREVFNSFSLAHKMGLSMEQEYELLQIGRESQRLKYLHEHLDQTIAVLQRVNRTREAIDMNGHFKNFDPLDFKEFKVQ